MKGPYVSRLLLVELVLGFTFWKTNDQLPSSHLYLSKIAKDVKLISFSFFFFLGFPMTTPEHIDSSCTRSTHFHHFCKVLIIYIEHTGQFFVYGRCDSRISVQRKTRTPHLTKSINSVEYPSRARRRMYSSVL